MPTSNHSKQILFGNLKTESCLCTSLFCSQVFKTSNVLNSDVNIVQTCKYCFDCFLLAGGAGDVEFTLEWYGSVGDSFLQLPFVLALL